MFTIASRVTAATLLAARHPGYAHSLAAAQAAAQPAGHGRMTLVVVILLIAALTAMKSAALGLSGLLSELLRAVAAMTSVLFVLAVASGIALILLLHH